MAAQSLHDLDALGHGSAEVAQAQGRIAGIDVVGTHTHLDQAVDQLHHHMGAVVDTGQQHGLVAQGDTGIGQHGAGLGGLIGELLGGVEVGVQPDGMILTQHGAQLGGDTLGAHHGGAGAQTDDLHVGNGAQALDDVLQVLIGDHQTVTAGQQDVTDLGMSGHIIDALVDLGHRHLAVILTGKTAAGAVTAVHGALVGDQQQHPVRIAMGQAGGGGVGVLVQGIGILIVGILQLLSPGDGHLADGIKGIVQVDQGQVVGGHGHAQLAQGLADTLLLVGGQVHVLLQVLNRLSAVGNLPMPVIPQIFGDIGEQTIASLHIRISLIRMDSKKMDRAKAGRPETRPPCTRITLFSSTSRRTAYAAWGSRAARPG